MPVLGNSPRSITVGGISSSRTLVVVWISEVLEAIGAVVLVEGIGRLDDVVLDWGTDDVVETSVLDVVDTTELLVEEGLVVLVEDGTELVVESGLDVLVDGGRDVLDDGCVVVVVTRWVVDVVVGQVVDVVLPCPCPPGRTRTSASNAVFMYPPFPLGLPR